MSFALFAIGVTALLLTVNAHAPRHSAALAVPSFFAGWLAIELAPHLLVAEAAGIGLTAAYGGSGAWPGRVGLGAGLVGMAGTAATIVASRRTVVTLRECGAPMEIDPSKTRKTSRYPVSHLVLPPLCLIPRRGVRVHRDIEYHREGRQRLKLDVYRPASSGEELRPGVMQIHGGAWVIGDKREQGLPLLNHLAVHGWVGFNVNYRLSPKATWPDHLIDLKHFIAWYQEHAAEYGADPDFLCVTGGSAGGHLAAMVALTAGRAEYQPGFEDVDTSVRAAVPFYGVYDLVTPGLWPAPMGATALMQRMVLKKSFTEDTEAFVEASPIGHLRPDAPPFFIVHGSHDTLVPVAEARRFAQRLRETSRSPVVYAEMRGGQHAFDVFPSYRTARVVEAVERFLTGLHRQYAEGVRRPTVPGEITESVDGGPVG
ncbi:alpha/beta hydrolase [Actinomadura sp. NBRC 104425]|uniref:alpha/beta hydrolase n=1 Tax=Actinomadura sp. NBRC 104425 TaxID=3032204 RepID=UPI0024A2765D|nr:alpha/beta hydrolase [Actinomadura sp. NBRC 104425]GLZ11098.1 alpha/beta hydrolase [Actinomadura sp. NBRC 104425]